MEKTVLDNKFFINEPIQRVGEVIGRVGTNHYLVDPGSDDISGIMSISQLAKLSFFPEYEDAWQAMLKILKEEKENAPVTYDPEIARILNDSPF